MFGLEKSKKNKQQKTPEETFELEQEMQDPEKGKALKAKVASRVQTLKQNLRTGDNKELFDQYGVLLHGYTALQKVIKKVSKL